MKKKDLVYAVIAVVILLVAGFLAYTQLVPKKSAASKVVQYEVVGKILPDFDAVAIAKLSDTNAVQNYGVDIDITQGVGNKDIFGK